MDKNLLVEKLNQAICLELGGMLQYNQYSQVLMGQDRMIWQSFFKDAADESLDHARKFAARMEEYGLPFYYYENTEGGHAAGANLRQAAHTNALEMIYLTRKLMD